MRIFSAFRYSSTSALSWRLVDEDAPARRVASSEAIERFMRMASDRNSACCLRSSGTSPMPCRIASRGERYRTGLPSTKMLPASNGSAPKTARAISVRPAPTRPAMPENFAAPDIEARRRRARLHAGRESLPRRVKPFDRKRDLAGIGIGAVAEERVDLAADHHADDAVDVVSRRHCRCRRAARRAAPCSGRRSRTPPRGDASRRSTLSPSAFRSRTMR